MKDKRCVDHIQNNSANSTECKTDSAGPRQELKENFFFFLKCDWLKITKLSKG